MFAFRKEFSIYPFFSTVIHYSRIFVIVHNTMHISKTLIYFSSSSKSTIHIRKLQFSVLPHHKHITISARCAAIIILFIQMVGEWVSEAGAMIDIGTRYNFHAQVLCMVRRVF